MSAPSLNKHKKRKLPEMKRAVLDGKEYRDKPYANLYGIGVICGTEKEQSAIYKRLKKLLPENELKVLVI